MTSDFIPAQNITIEDFSVWSESTAYIVNKINNVFGTGDDIYGANDELETLLAGAIPTTYTSTYTITAAPTGWTDPTYPAWAAPSTGYGCKLVF
jgi:rhamnogalacturonan hydrolase